MFSKALYKQSWKANGILWGITTLVSTFVLIIIMALTGGKGMVKLTSSFAETVVYEEMNSQFENTGLNYYSLSTNALEEFDRLFLEGMFEEIKNAPMIPPTEQTGANAYLYALSNLEVTLDALIRELNPNLANEDMTYLELVGAVLFVLNPGGEMNDMYESFEVGSTPEEYDVNSLTSNIDAETLLYIWTTQETPEGYYDIVYSQSRLKYRQNRSIESNAIFLAGNLSSEEAIDIILETINSDMITREVYDQFGFDYEGIKYIGKSAILTYQARYDYEVSLASDEIQLKEIKEKLKSSITANFITSLPESLRNMLADMEEQDVYATTMVSMYYKIVGLLISVIYIILASVNLMAGQVDSGSMAYILSTGTKRNQVSFTQSIYLSSSSFFMYLITTGVSLIVFQFATPVASQMTESRLLLFGLGTYLVSFAFIGINFLSSCIFNRSSKAMAVGGGVSILMLIFTILGMFGSTSMPAMMRMDALNAFNYFSIISLVDAISVMDLTYTFIWKYAILFGIGAITLVIGMQIFKKKDLPL